MKTIILLAFITVFGFIGCNNSNDKNGIELTQKEREVALTNGKEIAENTFKVLSGNLTKAMSEGGIEKAINYCNANASYLMDSLGLKYNANIRRTSNKIRNEKNAPNKEEQNILTHYLNGGDMKPTIRLLANGNKKFYAPINMKPLCITCHGSVGKTISDKNYSFISNHYSNDKAVNYKVGDFRGIWSIELKN